MPDNEKDQERVLGLFRDERDARFAVSVFAETHIPFFLVTSYTMLCSEMASGVGAVLVTEDSLGVDDWEDLSLILERQPEWSAVPVIVLLSGPKETRDIPALHLASEVLLLDEPVRVAPLMAVIAAALKSRKRQYILRDRIIQLNREIENRKKAENSLIRAKEEWEHTFDSVPDLIAILDEHHTIARVNRAMAERVGRKPEECVGLPCFEVIHRRESPPEFCPHSKTLDDVREHHVQAYDPALQGHFHVSTTPLIGADGKMHGAVHVARDITEQKRAAEEIERLNTNLTAHAADLEDANRRLAEDVEAMRLLQGIGMLYVHTENLEQILAKVLDAAIAITGAAFGNIQIREARTRALEIVAQRNLPQWWLHFWSRVTAGHGACGTAISRGERVIVEDVESDPIFVGTDAAEMQLKIGIRAIQSTPLISRSGDLIGVFSTHYTQPHKPTDQELRLLDLLARQAADIIEQARIARKLRESEEHFRTLANNMSQLAWMADEKGEIYWYNKRWYDYTGMSTEELSGLGWQQVLHPDHRSRALEKLFRSFETGTDWEDTHQLRRSDGTFRWFLCRAIPIQDERGRITRWFGTDTDVTELREAEEAIGEREHQLKTVIENLAEGLLHFNPEGKELRLNPAALELYNLQPGQEPGSFPEMTDIFELVTPEGDTVPVEEYPISFILRGETVRDRELLIRNRETKWQRVFSYSGQLVRDSHEQPVMGLLTVRDVTKRKQAEESLHESKAELERLLSEVERSNQDLQQFAYVASHDLQEPLRMVSSYMQLLDTKYKEYLDEKAQKYIYYAVDGATRMQNLIDGLLKYSRITHDRELSTVDTNATCATAMANLEQMLTETGGKVTADALPVVSGDESQLIQLFQNLIGNGLKYRKPGVAPHVHVAAHLEKGEWVFSVRDNGIGMEPQDRDRIFHLFQRLHTREEYPGTGIGLALCKKIVERHGGRIWVDSQPGKGSTFFFALPADHNTGKADVSDHSPLSVGANEHLTK